MNIKRLLLAILAGFVFVFVSDILIHGVWLEPDYQATSTMWRTRPEMQARMLFMWGGQLLFVVCFVGLWAAGLAPHSCGLGCAIGYGCLMGLFSQALTLIQYVVTPLPPELAAKWFISGVVQTMLLGVITFGVYQPRIQKSNHG
jgi:hypothetical protein